MKAASPFQVYYRLELEKNQTNFEKDFNSLIQAGINGVILKPNPGNFDLKVLEKIQLLCNSKIDVYLEDDFESANHYNFTGVILSKENPNVGEIKKKYPHLKIGGKATNLAACKNWELQKIDFIEFCPPTNLPTNNFSKQILGAESFTQIFPKEEAYGWMILSLNLPVVASGIHQLESLKEIKDMTSIIGAIISDQFEPKISREKIVCEILK